MVKNMTIRKYKEEDLKKVEEIFALYWTDPEFLKELADELGAFVKTSGGYSGFFVAEDAVEIVGIVGFRKIPTYLNTFALTNNPVELYVIASKHRGTGIGTRLKQHLINELKGMNFSEILLFSPNSHKESWIFHDNLGFERVGEVVPPEDEVGQVWR